MIRTRITNAGELCSARDPDDLDLILQRAYPAATVHRRGQRGYRAMLSDGTEVRLHRTWGTDPRLAYGVEVWWGTRILATAEAHSPTGALELLTARLARDMARLAACRPGPVFEVRT